jgi:glycerate dehydrogenase
MKAVFLDFATMGPNLNIDGIRALLPELQIFPVTEDQEVAERIQGAKFILTNKIRLSAELLQGAPELRFVGLTATGTDNIDLGAAQQHGVAVCNIRAYCTRSVAEHVFACLLSLTHSIGQYNAAVRAGEWQLADDFCLLSYPIRELSAMTLGIVGYGELGKGVEKIARSFGMQVIVSARPGSATIDDGRVSFEELLRRADVISLHCPLNDTTRGLFGAPEFAKMRSDAILINTARGGLIDSAALADALQAGDIAAAAVDVLPKEPPVDGDPLLDYDGANLLVTPHIAWATGEARQAAIDELVANIAAFLDGRERNRIV